MKTKGKYFLDQIDNIIYSTDSYELYSLFYKIVYDYDVHLDKKQDIFKKSFDSFPANKETWEKALQQEKNHYENGYIYKSKLYQIKGKRVKKGRWVKDSVKAKQIFEDIKNYQKDLII